MKKLRFNYLLILLSFYYLSSNTCTNEVSGKDTSLHSLESKPRIQKPYITKVFRSELHQPTPPAKPTLSKEELEKLNNEIKEHFGRGISERLQTSSDDIKGAQPLHKAVADGDLNKLELLYKHPDFNINALAWMLQEGRGLLYGNLTAYHYAKDLPTTKWLWEHGCKVELAFDKELNTTPLHTTESVG